MDFSQDKYFCTVRQLCENKIKSFTVMPSRKAKSGYFIRFRLFKLHLLVQLRLPMVNLDWSQSNNLKRIKYGAWL